MHAFRLTALFLVMGLCCLLGDVHAASVPKASASLAQIQGALKSHNYRKAIEQLVPATRQPGFEHDAQGPALLMILGEQSEAYVHLLNQRYWKRSRLDPHSPSWLSYIRSERKWAGSHLASFEYDEPGGRYRSAGEAYKLLLKTFPKDPAREEASWHLLQLSEPRGDRRSDPALRDADRYRQFLKSFPSTKHRLAAKLAIGWDYLYASGFTWGPPDKALFKKGESMLREVIAEAPASREANQARRLLTRTKNPYSYSPSPQPRVGK